MADRPRRRPRIVTLVVAMVFGWLAWLGANAGLAGMNILRGLDALHDARATIDPEEIAAGHPLPALRRAESEFARAHDRFSEPVWAPVRALPVWGRQVRSVSALASASAEVADVLGVAVGDVQGLLAERPTRAPDRPILLRQLADLANRADARLAAVGLGPRESLLPPVARWHNRFADELDRLRSGLRRGAVGGEAAAELLAGPQRYLVFAANNAEMRAGSGMFLSVGELELKDGTIRVGSMTTVEDLLLPSDAVRLEGDLAARWGWLRPNEDWRNLMVSPRFDASAELAARMWVALGKPPVDGVIALDPIVLQALLEAAGPIPVESGIITKDSVVSNLLHDQYLQFPADEQIAARREQLSSIAQGALVAANRDQTSLPVLARGLAQAAQGRHLLVWSADARRQEAWRSLGVDGSLRSDSLLVSLLNRGGNKLDFFVHVSADLSFRPEGANTAGTLRLVIENRVPPGKPAYIAGPRAGSGVGPEVYLAIVTATLPGWAQGARIEGVDALAVVGADGPTRVVGMQLSVPRGQSRTVVVRFELPGHEGSLVVEPSARIPPIGWTNGRDAWSDVAPHRVDWRI